MKELYGGEDHAPTTKSALQVDKEQRTPPYSMAGSDRCSLSAHNLSEADREQVEREQLRYLAKLIVNSYMKQHGL